VAAQSSRAYAGNDKLAALTVAGSVGAGLADGFSDLELDCYWAGPPGDLDRSGPVNVLGGELEALWDYDHDEQEWSDDYRLGDLQVTVSSFLVSTIDGQRADPHATSARPAQIPVETLNPSTRSPLTDFRGSSVARTSLPDGAAAISVNPTPRDRAVRENR